VDSQVFDHDLLFIKSFFNVKVLHSLSPVNITFEMLYHFAADVLRGKRGKKTKVQREGISFSLQFEVCSLRFAVKSVIGD
jgi:hypothetical protein